MYICALRAHRARPLRVFLLYRVDNRIHAYSTRAAPFRASAEVLANHSIGGNSKYALVAGVKVYTLSGSATEFEKYAGKRMRVTGEIGKDAITVSSIGAVDRHQGFLGGAPMIAQGRRTEAISDNNTIIGGLKEEVERFQVCWRAAPDLLRQRPKTPNRIRLGIGGNAREGCRASGARMSALSPDLASSSGDCQVDYPDRATGIRL